MAGTPAVEEAYDTVCCILVGQEAGSQMGSRAASL